jgi:NAD(P)-dependent dehydrogenase (short-subunit alcohol dehydrogenase family)
MMVRNFSGRTVLVTGAAGGLGRSLCLCFAAAGARIAALDRDRAGLEALAVELGAAGSEVFTAVCDVTDAPACDQAVAAVLSRFGSIDVLINNAGIAHRSAFAETALAVLHRVMDVNYFGAVHCTHAALPALTRNRGLIIAISSVAGFAPLIGRTGYAASKHALHGFFDSLRTELQDQGVGVLLVCPSFIVTGIDQAALGGDGAPAGRPRKISGAQTTPEEVASAVLRAARRGRTQLLFGATSRLAWWLTRLWPARYAAIMKHRLQSEISPSDGASSHASNFSAGD